MFFMKNFDTLAIESTNEQFGDLNWVINLQQKNMIDISTLEMIVVLKSSRSIQQKIL